jgi:hypothetical protein
MADDKLSRQRRRLDRNERLGRALLRRPWLVLLPNVLIASVVFAFGNWGYGTAWLVAGVGVLLVYRNARYRAWAERSLARRRTKLAQAEFAAAGDEGKG